MVCPDDATAPVYCTTVAELENPVMNIATLFVLRSKEADYGAVHVPLICSPAETGNLSIQGESYKGQEQTSNPALHHLLKTRYCIVLLHCIVFKSQYICLSIVHNYGSDRCCKKAQPAV